MALNLQDKQAIVAEVMKLPKVPFQLLLRILVASQLRK